MSVTKHLVLKIKNLKTQPHNDTKIRIKLLGSEGRPVSSVNLSPAVQELTFVVPSRNGWKRDQTFAHDGRGSVVNT